MNVKNKPLRILGTVGAVLLSIPLVIAVVVAPLYSSVASIITPKTLTQVIQDVDYAAMMAESDALQDMANAEHLPSEMMTALITSDFAEDILTGYMEEAVAILRNEPATGALSKENILAIAEEHMDDLVELVSTYAPEKADMPEEELRDHIRDVMDDMGDELSKTLPPRQEVLGQGESAQLVTLLVDTGVPLILYGAVAVLAALVFVCLLHRFRGLLCLGIDGLVALVPLITLYSLLQEGGLLYNQIVTGDSALVIASLMSVLSQNLLISVIAIAVTGLALIAGYTVYRNRLKKSAVDDVPVEAPELPQE